MITRYQDLELRIYVYIIHFYQVHISEITGFLLLVFNSILMSIISPELLKFLSSILGVGASLLLFLGGIWYVRKQVLDSRKARLELEKAKVESLIKDKELRMMEIDLQSKELDNKIKEKDLELFHLSRLKMETEEEHSITKMQLEIQEMRLEIKKKLK